MACDVPLNPFMLLRHFTATLRMQALVALLGLGLAAPVCLSATDPARASVTILSTAPRGNAYWSPQVIRAEGVLDRSLYRSFAAVLSDSILAQRERAYMAWEIAEIFRWEADFTRGFRSGDHFKVIFERLLSPFGEVRYGRLLAADIVLQGRTLTAFEFDDAQGRTAFYDAQGKSLRRDFLRVPVEFKRISSEFGVRYHPILRRWRGHEGIDYAASSGSPVMSVGDGQIVRAGNAGGYGRLVEIRHGDGLITRYAHLRGFGPGVRAGAHVEQGQVIGYVGKTGLATGPHLHFEFRVNGVARDPDEITSGEGAPIPLSDRSAFLALVDRYRGILRPEQEMAASR
jgi:murein DD-endopeptidase MepM/ murein hydrolase activator NlpD